jgi:DNA-binding transcriptional ArsR family regulator
MLNPDVPIHLRGAVRELKEEINAVRRELIRLEEIKLITSEKRGNRKYYMLNSDGPFVEELRGMIYKTFGIGGEIIRNAKKIGDISFALLTGTYITGVQVQAAEKPVDLVVVGEVNLDELNPIIKEYEEKKGKEINYTIFTLEEFDLRKKRNDNFIINLLVNPKIMLIGTQEDLVS